MSTPPALPASYNYLYARATHGPSEAVLQQGLGSSTTPQAVSRVLKLAGYRAIVWRSPSRHNIIWVVASPLTDQALLALHARGYAAERGPEGDNIIAVYGRRPA